VMARVVRVGGVAGLSCGWWPGQAFVCTSTCLTSACAPREVCTHVPTHSDTHTQRHTSTADQGSCHSAALPKALSATTQVDTRARTRMPRSHTLLTQMQGSAPRTSRLDLRIAERIFLPT